MTARAAAEGGADFLLVLSAGRLRVMGAPSLASMLPIRDSNGFTDAFARQEILDRVAVPVFFGAAACDPRLSIEALLDAGSATPATMASPISRPPSTMTARSAPRWSKPGSASRGRSRCCAPRRLRPGDARLRQDPRRGGRPGRRAGGAPLPQLRLELGRQPGRAERRAARPGGGAGARASSPVCGAGSPGTLCFVEGGPIIDHRAPPAGMRRLAGRRLCGRLDPRPAAARDVGHADDLGLQDGGFAARRRRRARGGADPRPSSDARNRPGNSPRAWPGSSRPTCPSSSRGSPERGAPRWRAPSTRRADAPAA